MLVVSDDIPMLLTESGHEVWDCEQLQHNKSTMTNLAADGSIGCVHERNDGQHSVPTV